MQFEMDWFLQLTAQFEFLNGFLQLTLMQILFFEYFEFSAHIAIFINYSFGFSA